MNKNKIPLIFFFILLLLMQKSVIIADENSQDINLEIIQQTEIIKYETEALIQKLEVLHSTDKMVKTSSITSISDLIHNINNTIEKLGELIDAAKILTENTNQQVTETGITINKSMESFTKTIENELNKLTIQLTNLIQSIDSTIQSTDKTIQTVNTTVKHIDTAATQTVKFISSFGGRVVTSYYFGEEGLDSSADIVLWKKNNKEIDFNYSYLRLTLDGVDNPDNRELSVIIGTNKNWFSIGAGYIQNGIGLDIGINQFGDQGFDSRLSIYNMRKLGINSEIGYRPTFLKGTRLFVFGEDILQNYHNYGGGIAYERKF